MIGLLKNDIILNFDDLDKEIQGATTSQYVINEVLETNFQRKSIIEESKFPEGKYYKIIRLSNKIIQKLQYFNFRVFTDKLFSSNFLL